MNDERYTWVEQAKSHGFADSLHLLLNTLEPFGILGAQMIWVMQPALGLFVRHETLRDIARSLEEPGGVEHIRQLLDAPPPDKPEAVSTPPDE